MGIEGKHSCFELVVVPQFMEEGAETMVVFEGLGDADLVGLGELTGSHVRKDAVSDIDIIILHAENIFQAPLHHGG